MLLVHDTAQATQESFKTSTGSGLRGLLEAAPLRELDGQERRRGLRVRQNRPVKVFEPSASRYFGGQTHDISSTGLRLELPVSMAVRPGKVLNVHVGLSDSGQTLANRRQMLPARVVWVNRQGPLGRGRTMVGVEFMSSIAAHLDAA